MTSKKRTPSKRKRRIKRAGLPRWGITDDELDSPDPSPLANEDVVIKDIIRELGKIKKREEVKKAIGIAAAIVRIVDKDAREGPRNSQKNKTLVELRNAAKMLQVKLRDIDGWTLIGVEKEARKLESNGNSELARFFTRNDF